MSPPKRPYRNSPRKTSQVTWTTPRLRSAGVDATAIGPYASGDATILHVDNPTGLWTIARDFYRQSDPDITSLEIKERMRVIRQANPGWQTWTDQQVPAGTALILPPAGRQLLSIPGAQPVVVARNEGLIRILQRHYSEHRGVGLTAQQAQALVPTVAAINAIHDVDHELEPDWVIYVPDEASDTACDTSLCTSDQHRTALPDDPGSFQLRIDINSQLYLQIQNVIASTGAAAPNGDLRLIRDLTRNRVIRFVPQTDAAGRVTRMTIRGTNRALLQRLGVPGTVYRVGTPAYVQAMSAYSRSTGQIVMQGVTSATGASALRGALGSVGRVGAYGAAISVGIDAMTYVWNGEADRIATRDFGIRAGNNATNALISAGAGTMASALTVAAMSAAGCSVVPGIGTAVGFVVGLAVGAALAWAGVTWWE